MQAYLFPGQGSQFVGMGRALCETYPVAQDVFGQADSVLGFSLSRVCFEGPEEVLGDTLNTQPAMFVASVAALRALSEAGVGPPAYVAGHSMGELSALAAAGAISFKDGLRLARERGRLMKEAGERSPGGMAAVLALDRDVVEDICAASCDPGGYVGVANDNCPGQIVISGAEAALERAMALARERGAKRVQRLAVSIAAHSPLMAGAADAFSGLLGEMEIAAPSVPLVANATASPLVDPGEIRTALGRQLTSPVRWTESVRWMIAHGVSCFVEVGPRDVLSGLVRRVDRDVERVTTARALGLEGEPG